MRICSLFAGLLTLGIIGSAFWVDPVIADDAVIKEGKELAFNRKKGNCLACHAMDDGTLAGNSGPPLIQMKLRFPDEGKLREQIADATVRNPNTMMPPFGRHAILSEDEIDKITAYVHTL